MKKGAEATSLGGDAGDPSRGTPRGGHRAGGLRVLFANAPLSYRQAMAVAIETLRPEVEVLICDPDALDLEVERFCPDLVVCSHVTALVKSRVPAWVELYPDESQLATIVMGNRRTKTVGIELDDLLSIVDQRARGRVSRG